jgi:alpha-galactosidase
MTPHKLISSVMLALAFYLLPINHSHALTNGLALTPPMGWNSWYAAGVGINESYIKSIADDISTNGMREAGYNYVCMDDGWAGYRDTNGVMVADTNKFPSGIKALADYIHSKGLKLGIYTVFGPTTCAGLPGSFGHEVQDAQTYAEWGIDYLKYEGCSFPDPLAHEQEKANQMRDALLATGRPIVFTMSTGPNESWFPDSLNMWRGTGDNVPHSWDTFLHHLDFVAQNPELAGPGHWNDPDVLDIGIGWSSGIEDEAMFGMYCMVAAPLLTKATDARHLNVLTNTEAIAIDQDAAGIQGVCLRTNGDLQVWCKPLGGTNTNFKAVALFNRGTNAADITVNWAEIGLPPGTATVRDIWARAYAGNFTNSFTTNVPPHGMQFLKIAYGSRLALPPVGTNYISDLPWLASATNAFGPIKKDMSNGGTLAANAGGTITVNSKPYSKGLGVNAYSVAEYYLGKAATRFQSDVGVDSEVYPHGSVVFEVWADGVKLFDSGLMSSTTPAKKVDVDLTGREKLSLIVQDGGDGNDWDHADWAGARLIVSPRAIIEKTAVGTGGIEMTGNGGLPNSTFYLLGSSNFFLPANQWTTLATNHFDANGRFTLTNAINPVESQVFYRLLINGVPIPTDSASTAYFTAANITNNATRTAINAFIVNAKAHGYWNKLKEVWGFPEGTPQACTNGFKLAFSLIPHGGVTYSSNGITGNATNAYMDTGITPSTALSSPASSMILVDVVAPQLPNDSYFAGVNDTGSHRFGLNKLGANLTSQGLNNGTAGENVINGGGDFRGIHAVNRDGNTSQSLYLAGMQAGGTNVSASTGLPNKPIYLLGRNNQGSPGDLSNITMDFAAIGENFTAADMNQMIADIAAYLSARRNQAQ